MTTQPKSFDARETAALLDYPKLVHALRDTILDYADAIRQNIAPAASGKPVFFKSVGRAARECI